MSIGRSPFVAALGLVLWSPSALAAYPSYFLVDTSQLQSSLDQQYRRQQDYERQKEQRCEGLRLKINFMHYYYVNQGRVYTVDYFMNCGITFKANLGETKQDCGRGDDGVVHCSRPYLYKIEEDTVYYNGRPVKTTALCRYESWYDGRVGKSCERRIYWKRDGSHTYLDPSRFPQL